MRKIHAGRLLAFGLLVAFAHAAWAQPLTVTTSAGQFLYPYHKDGVGTNTGFFEPAAIRADQAGNLYVIEANAIRKISPNLTVTTFAGMPYVFNGLNSGGYVDANGENAQFDTPAGLAVDKQGYVYVADQGNNVVRKVSPSGDVTTVAGNGSAGYVDGARTDAEFNNLAGIAVDSSGNIYVSDYYYGFYQFQNRAMIRKITPDGVVSTLAGGYPGYNDGTGPGAGFEAPQGLTVDAGGNVYVADNFGIRIVSPAGTVTTWAGSQFNEGVELDGAGAAAGFSGAHDIALDRAGGAYVVDGEGSTVRYVSVGGVVSTVAGLADTYAVSSNNGVGSAARFDVPYGIAMDSAGDLHITDILCDTVLEGVPPALPPVGSVSESPGGTPVTSSSPWQFTAYYTELVSDLRLRVQSTLTTNDEGSWTDLPASTDMTDSGGNWNLNAAYVPGGLRWFRVVASAPGYADGDSAIVGPESVAQGMAPFGSFTTQTITPYQSGTAWTFNMVETPVIAGLGLSVQANNGSGWADLPDGQMSTSDSVNWTVTSLTVPSGTVSFQVVASAPTYPNQISAPLGPFTIVPGLPGTGAFLLTTGGTPVRSSNPWQFLVVYTNQVAGLQLRVQSSATNNDNGSWEDLPENPYMTNDAGAWTLNCTDVPTGVQYFRVVASASGYLDGFSTTVGPQTVLAGFNLWGLFTYATTVPYWTATPWSFAITQPATVPGMSLRMQSSQAEYPGIWTDLPGVAQMTLSSDGQTWVLYTTNLPTGLITFQVVASAPNYVDLASGPLGPFPIVTPLAASTTSITQGTTESIQDVGSDFASAFNHVINAIGAEVHLILDGNTTTQGAVTLTGSQGGSVGLTVDNGQVFTAAGVSVGSSGKLIANGTVNADVNVGIIGLNGSGIIGLNGSGIVGEHSSGLLHQDGGGLLAKNSASLDMIATAALLQGTAAPVLSQNGSAVLSQNGSAVIGVNGAAVIGVNGAAVVTGKVKSSVPTPTPLGATPNTPHPNTPPTQPVFTGIMTVNGDYNQLAGALIIAIAGTNTASDGAQQYDQLAVSGQANFFGGCIAFGLFDPDDQTDQTNVFQPPDGATFDIVVASNIVTTGLSVRGPLWGDGQFITWSVVTRPDGLQALRLVAVESPPILFAQSAGPLLQLAYATNYTGYSVQSAPDLTSGNWTTLSTGTNVVTVNPTNTSQFFQLSQP